MYRMAFRAWDGHAMVYDIAVDRHGRALRRVTPESECGVVAYVPEPAWIVSRWSGLTDRDDTRIFGHDVVELGGIHDSKSYGVVLYERGRFTVRRPHAPSSESVSALSKYCTPVFVHMIKVVGTIYDEPWRETFRVFVGEYSAGKDTPGALE